MIIYQPNQIIPFEEETEEDRLEHIRVEYVDDVQPEDALQVDLIDVDLQFQDPHVAQDIMIGRLFFLTLNLDILYKQVKDQMTNNLRRYSMRLQERPQNDFVDFTLEQYKNYFVPLVLVDSCATIRKQFRRSKYRHLFNVTNITQDGSCFLVEAQALSWENNFNDGHLCFVNFVSLFTNQQVKIYRYRAQGFMKDMSSSSLQNNAVFGQCTSRSSVAKYQNEVEARRACPDSFLRMNSRHDDGNYNIDLCTYIFRIYVPPESNFHLELNAKIYLKKIFPLSHVLPTIKALSTLSYEDDFLVNLVRPTRDIFFSCFEAFGIFTDFHLNLRQKQYVYAFIRMHLERKFKILLLQGPPGTGKTSTIVSAIKILILNILFNPLFRHLLQKFRIVVCANSNGPTDQLAKSLMALKKNLQTVFNLSIVRIGNPTAIADEVRLICLGTLKQNKLNYFSEVGITEDEAESLVLNESHIIVSTLASVTSGKMRQLTNKITTLIVDEGSHATEPSNLPALSLKPNYLSIIGDHQQLAPTILSQYTPGLKKSLFERLWVCQHSLGLETLTLRVQYRMHPEICSFPSDNFYHSELIPANNMIGKSEIGLKPFLVFDLQDTEELLINTSKCNRSEIDFIFRLLHSICQKISHQITEGCLPPDTVVTVGVLSFYDAQRREIQERLDVDQILKNANYLDIQVSNVDAFQGQQKDVILLTCVRTIPKEKVAEWRGIPPDIPPNYAEIQKHLGFTRDQRRINVAASRAKFAFYTVMNADSLCYLHVWSNFVDYAWSIARCARIPPYQLTNGQQFNQFLYDILSI